MKFLKQLFKKYLCSLSKNKNIYKVDYQIHPILGIIIIIEGLDIYFDSSEYILSNRLFKHINGDIFGSNYLRYQYNSQKKDILIKNIEINEQLQQLLYSDDDLNRSLGTQIIFNKLGINYER